MTKITRDAAETLALQALAWVIAEDDLRDVFMGATGTSQDDVRTRASDPDFLSSVMDFLVMDDAWVVRFCEATGHDYQLPMMARAMLPGGEAMHWT